MTIPALAPGARIEVRDVEWLVRQVDRTSSGGDAIRAVGLSEIVRDKETIFLTEIEDDIKVVDPAETRLVADESQYYRDSRLYIESQLRLTPPTDNRIRIGNHGAMDLVPYQLDPAHKALGQPRQRILIADAVGLGKTIECGILLSELIQRGRGKRILVLAVKSMLTQFQKELWARFTIPLVRLDSIGIQRIRRDIPTNHNPFYYYDKSIVSIDTLKQEAEYRTYIESSYWDIIVIDEAHNVAERGSNSLRSRLAGLIASRSDTLIMLSATPHDGRKRSFASLMNMLDPTAIANPDDYGPEDIRGLHIRRFKKDIKDQVAKAFPEREIATVRCPASSEEEKLFASLADLEFSRIDRNRTGHRLFKTTLEKALFSSPAACHETVCNRIKKLKADSAASEYTDDLNQLEDLRDRLAALNDTDFSKYDLLLRLLRDQGHDYGWSPKDPTDRLVIFTDRLDTMEFLAERLQKDLKLKVGQLATLHGSMADHEIQDTVEAFGSESKPVRLLIASDVASEGINLHYQCHRLIHFDIPWSLMVFQQRNGRIDRYGQERQPLIRYLLTESAHKKVRGDLRILELLIAKDREVVDSIGDPSEFTGCYDTESEEARIAKAIETGQSPEGFEKSLKGAGSDDEDDDFWAEVFAAGSEVSDATADRTADRPRLYASDYAYLKDAVQLLKRDKPLDTDFDDASQTFELTPPRDLEQRLRYLPKETLPKEGRVALTGDL